MMTHNYKKARTRFISGFNETRDIYRGADVASPPHGFSSFTLRNPPHATRCCIKFPYQNFLKGIGPVFPPELGKSSVS